METFKLKLTKKLLVGIFILFSLNCFSQDTITVKLVNIQPGVYKLAEDNSQNLSAGVFLFITGTVLNKKPYSVQEIIAMVNLLVAQVEAALKEK